MAAVLAQDASQIVEYDLLVQSQVIQCVDAGQNTRWSSMGRLTVCDDGHVRIDNQRHHCTISFLRCVAAREIAAISPNSSPKKSFGQFLMSPNRSTSSGVSDDPSFPMSQK